MLVHGAAVCSFLSLCSIPVYEHTDIYLYNLQLMDTGSIMNEAAMNILACGLQWTDAVLHSPT